MTLLVTGKRAALCRKPLVALMLNYNVVAVENEFEKLNERKKYYTVIDDDTIHSLIQYYKLEHDNKDHHKEVVKFAKDTSMKGDTFD